MSKNPELPKSLVRGFTIVFFTVFLAIWYTIVYLFYGAYQEGEQATHWPTVEGTILEAKIESKNSTSESRDSQGRTTRRTETQYVPRFSYQYRVDDQQYVNGTLQKIGNPGSRHAAQQVLKRFPKGSQAEVYYDPKNPQNSVLIPGNSTTSSWVLWSFALGPILILLIVLVFRLTQKNRSPVETPRESSP